MSFGNHLEIIPEWSSGFPYFLQFQSEFDNKEFMIWATVSSQSCFCWLSRASPSLAAKNIISLISVLTIWWSPYVESSLVLLEKGVCYDQCVFLANSISQIRKIYQVLNSGYLWIKRFKLAFLLFFNNEYILNTNNTAYFLFHYVLFQISNLNLT